MARPALMDSLTRIAEPVVTSMGLEIWGIEILQGGRPVVRLYVDVPLAANTAMLDMPSTDGTNQDFTQHAKIPYQIPAKKSGKKPHPKSGFKPSQDIEGDTEPVREAVSIEQCAKISRMVGLALEVEEIFSSAYILEVSSPGLSRQFFHPEQMCAYVGSTVELTLIDPQPQWPGRKKFRGVLLSAHDSQLSLKIESGADNVEEQQNLEVQWENVRKAARVHIFIDPEKPGHKKKQTK